MARTGDALGYYYEEGYIDEGYIRYEPYIEDGYVDANYFQEEGVVEQASATLAVSTTITVDNTRIRSSSVSINAAWNANIFAVASKNGSIDMAVQTLMSSDGAVTRSTDITLDTIVNLSLQGDRTRTESGALSASFDVTPTADRTRLTASSLAVSCDISSDVIRIKQFDATLLNAFTPTITGVASLNGSIDLNSQAILSAEITRIKPLSASLNFNTNISVRPAFINFDLEPSVYSTQFNQVVTATKPTRNPTIIVQSLEDDGLTYDSLAITQANSKFGSGSAKFNLSRSGSPWYTTAYGYIGSSLFVIAKGYTGRSTDNGETWTQLTNNLPVSPVYYFYTGNSVVVVSGSTAYTSSNGVSWSSVSGVNGDRDIVRAGSYWYRLDYTNNRILRGTSLSNLTQWTVFNTNFGGKNLFSDGTTLFYIDYSTASNSRSIRINNNTTNFDAGTKVYGKVSDGKLLLTSTGYTAGNNYGVYTTSGSGTSYSTPNNDECYPVYFDGTNIVLETQTGILYSGTAGNLTQVYNFEETEYSFDNIFKQGLTYVRTGFGAQGLVYKSENLTDWTAYLNTAIRDTSPYVKIDNENKFSNDWSTIDFWHYGVDTLGTSLLSNFDSQLNFDIRNSSRRLQLRGRDGLLITSPSNTLPINTWNHVRITRSGSNIAIYINGSRVGTTSYDLNENAGGLYLFGGVGNTINQSIDELYITTNLLSDPVNDTSYTVPTTPWEDPADGTTLLLMHFDSDFSDDAPQPLGAEFYVNFVQTSTAIKSTDAVVNLNNNFNLSVDATVIQSTSVNLNVNAALNVETGFIQSAESQQNTTFTQIATTGVIRRAVTSLQAQFTQNASSTFVAGADTTLNTNITIESQITRIKPLDAQLDAFVTTLTTAGKVGDFFVNADLQASQTVDAVKTVDAIADLNSAFTQTAQVNRTRDTDLDAAVSASLTATASRQLETSITATASAQQVLDATRIREVDSDLQVFAQLDTDASGGFIGLTPTDLGTVFALDTTSTRIQPGNANLDTNFALETSALRTVGFASELTSASEVAALATRTRDVAVDLEAFNSQVTLIARRASAITDIDVAFTMVATGVTFAENETPLAVNTAMQTTAQRLRDTSVQYSSTATQDTSAVKAVEAVATLDSAGVFAVTARVTSSNSVDFEAVFTPVDWSASATRTTSVDVDATVTQTVLATATRTVEPEFLSEFTQTAAGGLLASADAVIESVTGLTATLKKIKVDVIVYDIPREVRVFTVTDETRTHTIHQETRSYSIQGDE